MRMVTFLVTVLISIRKYKPNSSARDMKSNALSDLLPTPGEFSICLESLVRLKSLFYLVSISEHVFAVPLKELPCEPAFLNTEWPFPSQNL